MTDYNIMLVHPPTNKPYIFAVKGFEIPDVPIRCFVHHKVYDNQVQKSWMATEFYSGQAMTSEWPTKNEAIEACHRVFTKMQLQDIKDIINMRVKQYGYANTDGKERSKK